jgi:acyl transferase domain-containing protein/NAD(P)-dependent dehydrogenase (short-subunit alcohol dehydrogenase family)/acyl carrier protein
MNNEFDIAIVGMSCRLPGAQNLDEFWRNLAGGIESITRFSDQEILQSGVPASCLSNPSYVKAAPVLDEPGHFDAAFFGFSPMEAKAMDPQHRILLELAYEALENAGYDPDRGQQRIGVFTGAALNTYFMNVGLNSRLAEEYIPTLIGNDKDFLSTRISYKLNLKGPSITVQTACSTSLVAVHLARQSLLSGETDMALAGAISVRVPQRAGYFYDSGGVVSPDGHVRAFDAKANGTVFGSGGGILVLKRLADALSDGDTIHAVIRGSAVNNDGSEKAGYTAPSVNAQADAVVEALANAGVEADSISYIEAHGSGTPVGDPIEVRALTKAFRANSQRSGYCAIGSVKTNVGHLDAAAGVAGVIKTVLALEHRQLPPSLHFTQANPEIDFPSTPFYVNTHLREWASDGPRRAGVMSTGMGGTNAHIVLEEAPELAASTDARPPHLLILSAKTETALDQATRRLREFLNRNDSVNMSDVAYTLQIGRKAFQHRRCVVCTDRMDAIAALGHEGSKRVLSNRTDGSRRPVIFLLPGIGDHYVGMAHELYETWDVFKQEVDRCAQILEPHLGVDIRDIIYPKSQSWKNEGKSKGIDLKKMLGPKTDASQDQDARKLNQTLFAQPALFTIEYAMTRLWQSLGIAPDAIVGHSMGEYVAACLAGVLSLEDALRLIAARARLVNELPQGAMLAVTLPERELLALLPADLSISLINGPSLCVVAGPPAAVAEFESMLSARNVICRRVQNAHAFHSRMLEPIVKAFQAEVSKVQLSEPTIPYISNVTGTWITRGEATDPAYWARHATRTARFSDALHELWQFKNPILLEAGPGRTLGVLATQHPDRGRAGDPVTIASVRHHYENESDADFMLQSIGKLWLAGAGFNWENHHLGTKPRRIPLPTYPFERRKYWVENRESQSTQGLPSSSPGPEHSGIDNWFYVPTWERAPFPGDFSHKALEDATSWLVFTDRWGGGTGFRKKLEELGAVVQVARFGEKYRRLDDGSFEINPASPDDYVALFREIRGKLGDSLNIVHLGCLTADSDPADRATRNRNQDFGFFSLLYIAQAIGELSISIPIRIGIVSNRIHEVTGEETLDPGMATVLGPAGVIPKEFPNVACFSVDLPGPRVAEDPHDDVVIRILSEFTEPNEGGVLAYRGKYRWKRKYERVSLPEPTVSKARGDVPELRRLRERGVYLITGGTGGIGLAIVRFLAKACKARIVLTKKTAFPEKAKWNDLLNSRDAPESVIRTIREILEIERLGAEVEVFVAEVSDQEQMRGVIDKTLRRFRTINGAIHAAGIVRPELILALTKETAERVLNPKVEGAIVLSELLKNVNMDFLVLFSSMSSVTAPRGLSDYSAANCFLDAFANYSNSRTKTHTLTINWPGWKEVGMLAELEVLPNSGKLKEAELRKAISTKDGLSAFARSLNSDLQQIIVSPEELADVLHQSEQARDHAKDFRGERNTGNSVPPGIGQSLGVALPTNKIETAVSRIWTDVFGHEHIGIHQQFSELGGHSLIAMQIVAKVRSFYQIDLSLRDFFAAPTIARLSFEVEGRILREIENLSDDEAGRLVQTIKADEIS